MEYRKLNIIKFGKRLIETGDLDPVYLALWNVRINRDRMKRLLFAYWMFYHLGVAAKLSSYKGEKFYEMALTYLNMKSVPRGTERRHFRGEKAEDAVKYMQGIHSFPEHWVDELCYHDDIESVVKHVHTCWPQFGSWIAFKAADMCERLGLKRIKFPTETLKMYREPSDGAVLYMQQNPERWPDLQIPEAVRHLVKKFSNVKAPPSFNRTVNAQEVETILCKWKSHMKGHYKIGKDTKEIIQSLKGWGPLAERYRTYLKHLRDTGINVEET